MIVVLSLLLLQYCWRNHCYGHYCRYHVIIVIVVIVIIRVTVTSSLLCSILSECHCYDCVALRCTHRPETALLGACCATIAAFTKPEKTHDIRKNKNKTLPDEAAYPASDYKTKTLENTSAASVAAVKHHEAVSRSRARQCCCLCFLQSVRPSGFVSSGRAYSDYCVARVMRRRPENRHVVCRPVAAAKSDAVKSHKYWKKFALPCSRCFCLALHHGCCYSHMIVFVVTVIIMVVYMSLLLLLKDNHAGLFNYCIVLYC